MEPPYHFILIGDGASKDSPIKQSEKENISFVTFLPRIKEGKSRRHLNRQMFSLYAERIVLFIVTESPNKLGEYFYAAKPIIHTLDRKYDQ